MHNSDIEYQHLNASERLTAPPQIGISTVILMLKPPAGQRLGVPRKCESKFWLPLVRRTRYPFKDQWALPGGPLAWDHSLDEAARATLLDGTGLDPQYIEQLYTFGSTSRSASDLRLVTVAYWALIADSHRGPLPEIENVAWFPLDDLPTLAYDHKDIIDTAVARLRAKTSYADVVMRLLGEQFTIGELRSVYDAVMGRPSDPANFRRRMLSGGRLIATAEVRRTGAHRPARCYRFADPQTPESLSAKQADLASTPNIPKKGSDLR